MKQRIIAMLLCLVSIISLLPIQSFADESGMWHAGTSSGSTVGAGGGTFTTSQQGYRISIIDGKTGETVSNKADFLFGNAPKSGALFGNNKMEAYVDGKSAGEDLDSMKYYTNTTVLQISDLNNISGWPKWILYTGGWKENGSAFNAWFLTGKIASTGTGGGLNGYSSGAAGNTAANKKPTGTTSSSKPSTSGSTTSGGTTSGGTTSGSTTSARSDTYRSIINAMTSAYNTVKNAGGTKATAVTKGTTAGKAIYYNALYSGSFSKEDLDYFLNAISQQVDQWDQDYWSSINPLQSVYKELEDGSVIFDIAYAASNGYDTTTNGNIYKVLNATSNGNRVFKFTNGISLSRGADGVESVPQTVCDHGYYVLVEPIIWFNPERLVSGVRKDMYSEKFYGTPTNYGQFVKAMAGKWSDSSSDGKKGTDGVGGNYNYVCNLIGAAFCIPNNLLTLPESDENRGTLLSGVGSVSKNVKSYTLADNSKAYAVNAYWGDPGGFTPPSTQTYDNWSQDPHPDPHKAPDPDPTHPSPDKPYIPLVEGEPEEPWTDDWSGYQQVTRTVNIVKCYDIEHIDGTIEHVQTEARRYNPGTINVMQEPDYKVIGYYTSPFYIGYDIFQQYTMVYSPNQVDGIRVPSLGVFDTATRSTDWTDKDKSSWINPTVDTTWDGMRAKLLSWDTTYGVTSKFDKTVEYDKNAEAGKVVGQVVIGVAADLEYTNDLDRDPATGYDDNTLYVHLVKKESIPETSTLDEPDNPPSGKPPAVPPHPSEDPYPPNVPNDPETDPVQPGDRFATHRIIKVYETKTIDENGEETLESDGVFITAPTNPIVYIQDEAVNKANPKDGSWHLVDWEWEWETQPVPDPVPDNQHDIPFKQITYTKGLWDEVTSGVNPVQSGTTEAKVEILDRNDLTKHSTLYVHLLRIIEPVPVRGAINIEQSQISKAIHSNDSNIGGQFGNYSFAMTVGDFQTQHITHFDHCCVGGDHRYHSCRCLGHVCPFEMPGAGGDDAVTFNFDLTSGQDKLEIPMGVSTKTDPKVYGNGGGAVNAITTGQSYPETVSSLYASSNKFYYTSDGNDSNGAEYVTVLWRCSSEGLSDIPTLALFKKKDITSRYGAENYTLPETMLNSVGSSPDRKSNKKRASQPNLFDLKFSFGVHSRSDLQATASCIDIGGNECIATDTQSYYPIESTKFIYDFEATVAIQFYAGKSKPMAAQAPTQLRIKPVSSRPTHFENNIIQNTVPIKFYPYIRMTYMLNSLSDAEKEEQNTYETGYNQDVRKDTYVLSEYESSILPSDAVEIGWSRDGSDEESLLLTSQQWSIHNKAINSSWGGSDKQNNVLPGGAIYQLSTPNNKLATVMLTTYQTVVDEKARNEYLTSSSTIPSSEYTAKQAADEHKDFINDAKEVLDNLKVVQWVNNDPSKKVAWTSNFKDASGVISLRGLGENLSTLRTGTKDTANTDEKYYMRGVYSKTSFQDAELKDKTLEIRQKTGTTKEERANEGDLDIMSFKQTTTVFKVFTDTSGDVWYVKKESTATENIESEIESMVNSMKDINGDNTSGATKMFDKKVTAAEANSRIPDTDLKIADDRTKFVTNIVASVLRNKGDDPTAEWAKGTSDGKWYNEAFDGIYLVKQETRMQVGFLYSTIRSAALDPALCPPNQGQSDLYSKGFISQFCVDSKSDADIAADKPDHYIGTFKGTDLFLPDMESMYQSKKFYIPNANVQDLN